MVLSASEGVKLKATDTGDPDEDVAKFVALTLVVPMASTPP